MGEAWDQRMLVDAKAASTLAEAELARTTPEFLSASLELASQQSTKADTRAAIRFWMGVGTVIGSNVLVHLTWASAIVAVTWILVVYGWRG